MCDFGGRKRRIAQLAHQLTAADAYSRNAGLPPGRPLPLLLLWQPAALCTPTLNLQVETFESADAGASLTFPQQAGTIRKNGYIVISNRPCKVSGARVGAEKQQRRCELALKTAATQHKTS